MKPLEDSHAELLAAVTHARQHFLTTNQDLATDIENSRDKVNLTSRTARQAAFSRYSWALAAGAVASVFILVTVELWGSLREPSGPANNNAATVTVTAPAIPEPGDSILDKARGFTEHKQYGKAEAIYRSISQADPGDIEVKRLLVDILFRQKRYADCVALINGMSQAGVAVDHGVVSESRVLVAKSLPRKKPHNTHKKKTRSASHG